MHQGGVLDQTAMLSQTQSQLCKFLHINLTTHHLKPAWKEQHMADLSNSPNFQELTGHKMSFRIKIKMCISIRFSMSGFHGREE